MDIDPFHRPVNLTNFLKLTKNFSLLLTLTGRRTVDKTLPASHSYECCGKGFCAAAWKCRNSVGSLHLAPALLVSSFSNLGGLLTMKRVFALAAATIALTAAAPAFATTIDFVAQAQSGGQKFVDDGGVLNTSALGNLNLRFAGGTGGAGSDFAYFNYYGSEGGLGTCTTLDRAGLCTPFHDDSVSPGEFVRVEFVDAPFNIGALSFSTEMDGAHGAVDAANSLDLVTITTSLNNIVSVVTLTFAQASTTVFGLADWIQFDFVNREFWVSSISDVPVPGALPLLLSGLAGLGFASRRKKQA